MCEPKKLIAGLINEASLSYTEVSFFNCFDFTLLMMTLITGAYVGLLKVFIQRGLNRDIT